MVSTSLMVDTIPVLSHRNILCAVNFALTIYPPGIATVVPGEPLGGRAQPMLDYLTAFEQAANPFP